MRLAERPATPAHTQRAVDTRSTAGIGPWGMALMATSAATWTVVVGGLGVWRHAEFLSHRADLGNIVQAVWSTTRGRILEDTDGGTGEQMSRLASHVDPILVLYAPLWLLQPSPATLIFTQAAI